MKFFLPLVGLLICQMLIAQPLPESPYKESIVISKDASPSTQQEETIDPLQWLLEHKQERPAEVTLVKQTLLPIIVEGKTLGSVTKQQGSSVRLHDFNKSEVKTLINGTCVSIPIENTNLLDLAKIRVLNFKKTPPPIPLQDTTPSEDSLKSVREKLSQDPVKSEDILELYQTHPKELLSELDHTNIKITGDISKVFVTGIDHEKADITLSQKNPYKITISCDLKSPNRIVYINNHQRWKHKFETENGQLFLLSWYTHGRSTTGYYNRYYTTSSYYYSGSTLGQSAGGYDTPESLQKYLVCTERSNFKPYLVKLKSINGYNLVFEAVSSPEYPEDYNSAGSLRRRSTY